MTGVLNDYDKLAAGYDKSNHDDIFNAYYERPAMLALAGDVTGRRILDAGCGAGPLLAALHARGADVSGFDLSRKMLDLARGRVPDADLHVADIAEPLPYADAKFDDVIASLVLHYLGDWGPSLAELHRVVKPGGRLLVSVDHPFAMHMIHRAEGRKTNYFETYNYLETWDYTGEPVEMSFWNRPLHAMTNAFTSAGFAITEIAEPLPVPEAREKFPDHYRALTTSPSFLFFVLTA
ncbi:class I SAM-dependent methyltransferase [Lentzea sp. NBRC 102530]|uniref:class I SAM-dependent methyltransferase n=1 Tax=Lentzea sp. NBRC 102530 TaxID=3032201 RepID=UPI0024A5C8E8|nr:class I SAM-dependent methyltransferase [Lentzea sp. NBRC 102530]GLY50906.1 methyltransferase [Lentzea sp. NBRC 102530]